MTKTQEAGLYMSLLDDMVENKIEREETTKKKASTTQLQKYIIDQLFKDAYIIPFGPDCYRLRSKQHHPLRKFYNETFNALKLILRHRGGHFIIARSEVRKLHGNHYAKQKYRSLKINSHGQRNVKESANY